jgi:hypothetical protein
VKLRVSPNTSMTYVKSDPLMIHYCAILVCTVPRAADMLVPVVVMVSTGALSGLPGCGAGLPGNSGQGADRGCFLPVQRRRYQSGCIKRYSSPDCVPNACTRRVYFTTGQTGVERHQTCLVDMILRNENREANGISTTTNKIWGSGEPRPTAA